MLSEVEERSFRSACSLSPLNAAQFLAAASIGFLITLLGINDTNSAANSTASNENNSSQDFDAIAQLAKLGSLSFMISSLIVSCGAFIMVALTTLCPKLCGQEKTQEKCDVAMIATVVFFAVYLAGGIWTATEEYQNDCGVRKCVPLSVSDSILNILPFMLLILGVKGCNISLTNPIFGGPLVLGDIGEQVKQSCPACCYYVMSIIVQILEGLGAMALAGTLAWDGSQASVSEAKSASREIAAYLQIGLCGVKFMVSAFFLLSFYCCGSQDTVNLKAMGCEDLSVILASALSSALLLMDPDDTSAGPEVAMMLTGLAAFFAVKRSIFTVASRYGGTNIDMSDSDNRGVFIGLRVNLCPIFKPNDSDSSGVNSLSLNMV